MSIKIGHASIDENGKVAGGKVGDQTKKEICTRLWYDKDWDYYIECEDPVIANKAAVFVEQVCADPNYGYDQSERLTGYGNIVKNGGKVSGAKGEFDCSSLDSAAYIFAGLELSPSCTTRNIRSALEKTGKFKVYSDDKHLKSDQYAKRGGLYLKEGSHIVMALENGTGKLINPFTTPTSTVEFGETGTSVRWVQWELSDAGYDVKIDGEFGSKTDKAVRKYQEDHGLEINGKVGPKTRAYMMNN